MEENNNGGGRSRRTSFTPASRRRLGIILPAATVARIAAALPSGGKVVLAERRVANEMAKVMADQMARDKG